MKNNYVAFEGASAETLFRSTSCIGYMHWLRVSFTHNKIKNKFSISWVQPLRARPLAAAATSNPNTWNWSTDQSRSSCCCLSGEKVISCRRKKLYCKSNLGRPRYTTRTEKHTTQTLWVRNTHVRTHILAHIHKSSSHRLVTHTHTLTHSNIHTHTHTHAWDSTVVHHHSNGANLNRYGDMIIIRIHTQHTPPQPKCILIARMSSSLRKDSDNMASLASAALPCR